MKNILLFAGLVSIAGFVWGQNNANQELLMHLKNVRAELISIVDQNHLSRINELPQERLREYVFFRNLIDGFYSKAEVLQKIVKEEIVHPEFKIVCDNIGLSFAHIQNKFDILPTHQRMSTLVAIEGGFQAQDPIEISEQVKEELFELFVRVFQEAHREYCKTGNPLEESMTPEGIKGLFNEFIDLIIWHPEMLMHNWPMITLLDEKITELEVHAQSK